MSSSRSYVVLALLILVLAHTAVVGQSAGTQDTLGTGQGSLPAYDRPVDPELYLLRPGDRLAVTFVKTNVPGLVLSIDPEGRIVHETLGVFDLSDQSLASARSMLLDALKRLYRAEQIVISVSSPRQVAVAVIGAVRNPGVYRALSSQRVSDMIALAGGLTPKGSRRNIAFTGGPQPLVVDLDRALQLGDDTADPFLYAGTRVYVPDVSDAVMQVIGEVIQPRTVELTGSTDMAEAIVLAGGLTARADSAAISIIRLGGEEVARGSVLQPGDVIRVPIRTEPDAQLVRIAGEVSRPGGYEYSRDLRVEDLLSRAGGATEDANVESMAVFREIPADGPTNPVRYFAIGTGGGDVGAVRLKPGDSVHIPKKLGYVMVAGEVRNPGIVPYEANKSAIYFIELAGGYLDDAEREYIGIYRRLSKLTTRLDPESQVHDGDHITVYRRVQ